MHTKLGVARLIVFEGRWGMHDTVGIAQFLLASATSRFSSYIKLAYCSSTQELRGTSI